MENLLNMIESSYGIRVDSIEKIKNVYKLETSEGLKGFKVSKYDIRQYQFIINSIKHVLSNDFESVLPIQPSSDGRDFIEVSPSRYGFLCPWVQSREADYDNPVELRMCIDTLAQFHLASRGFPQDIIDTRYLYGRWHKRFRKRADEMLYFKALIAAKENKTEFDSIYLNYFSAHYRQALSCIKHLDESPYLDVMKRHKKESYLCHHDTANHNFLITPRCKVYMIDFDYCIQDTNLHDLCSVIIRNMKYGNWNKEVFNNITDMYSRTIPVTDEEKNVMACFMEFPQDFWQIGLQYYSEKQPWTEDLFLRKLKRTVNDSRERMAFIRSLFDETSSKIISGVGK